jgi:hypothetical protein
MDRLLVSRHLLLAYFIIMSEIAVTDMIACLLDFSWVKIRMIKEL